MQRLRIFAASTSDTAAERDKVAAAAKLLKPLADYLRVMLDVADWRSVLPGLGRAEQIILDQLDPKDWDVFIGILWHRFGTPTGGRDPQTQKEYLSGTEEEFEVAFRLFERHGRPRVLMYRCSRPIPQEILDPDQYKLVRDFFKQFEAVGGAHPGLFQSFDTTESFQNLLIDNLQRLLIEYGEAIKGGSVASEVIEVFAPTFPDNLPRRASFFGRDKDMEIVLRALSPEDRTWGVLLDGIGGIGKTALAVEAAHRCKERGLFDAFIFVSAKQTLLAPGGIRELTPAARTLDEFLNETARVLGQAGVPQLAGDAKRRALLDALSDTLLIYDNLETLTREEQEAVADFLRELPQGCKAITTSRRRGGEGAVWLRLGKLDWDAAHQLIAEEARKDSGLHAKLHRAGEARWPELYDETGGSPLALLHTLGLMRVRAALTFDRALEMLRGSRDADLQDYIFQEGHRELTTDDSAALRALSFFIPSATYEAWAGVSRLSRAALEVAVERLSALSLVDMVGDDERYTMHPLTRKFIRAELSDGASVEDETGRRFATYWVEYARRYGGSNENFKTFNLIEAEWENLNASAEWLWQAATAQGSGAVGADAARALNDLAAALCGAGGPLFYVGRWDESLKLNERAYEVLLPLGYLGDAGWRAYGVAWIHYYRADAEAASGWVERCAEAWSQGGNRSEQAILLRLSGLIKHERKDYEAAERLFQEALAIRRESGSDSGLANVLNSLGLLERERGRYDMSEQYYGEALALTERSQLKEGMTVQYDGLGLLELKRGRWSAARGWFEKELPLAREVGRQDLIAASLYGLACVHDKEGKPDLARPLAQEALAISRKLNHRRLPEIRELAEKLARQTGGQ